MKENEHRNNILLVLSPKSIIHEQAARVGDPYSLSRPTHPLQPAGAYSGPFNNTGSQKDLV
jgi:hypothetical protein